WLPPVFAMRIVNNFSSLARYLVVLLRIGNSQRCGCKTEGSLERLLERECNKPGPASILGTAKGRGIVSLAWFWKEALRSTSSLEVEFPSELSDARAISG